MYLLDTNALSEPFKRRPSAPFVARLEGARGIAKFTSAVCVMELRYGCARRPDGETLWRRIRQEVLERIVILPIDGPVGERAGDLLAAIHRRGRPRSTEDLLIAATCLVHRLTLVTRNRRDFADLAGLRVEDWMEEGKGTPP